MQAKGKPATPPRGARIPGQKVDVKSLKRLVSYMAKHKITLIVVAICIILSSITTVASSVFLQVLIDDYIVPILGSPNPVFTGLLRLILIMCAVFSVGIFSG